MVDEVCNEERFSKVVTAGLKEIRNGTHDGLFTANQGEENWAIAHRVLVPAFGPLMIRGMFDDMYDIATQLVMKWARQGPSAAITVTDDFTRLTLDTLPSAPWALGSTHSITMKCTHLSRLWSVSWLDQEAVLFALAC